MLVPDLGADVLRFVEQLRVRPVGRTLAQEPYNGFPADGKLCLNCLSQPRGAGAISGCDLLGSTFDLAQDGREDVEYADEPVRWSAYAGEFRSCKWLLPGPERPGGRLRHEGESGTAIKTVSKVIYEVLPSERKRSFLDVEMGAIPEQVAYFSCYVSGSSVRW